MSFGLRLLPLFDDPFLILCLIDQLRQCIDLFFKSIVGGNISFGERMLIGTTKRTRLAILKFGPMILKLYDFFDVSRFTKKAIFGITVFPQLFLSQYLV